MSNSATAREVANWEFSEKPIRGGGGAMGELSAHKISGVDFLWEGNFSENESKNGKLSVAQRISKLVRKLIIIHPNEYTKCLNLNPSSQYFIRWGRGVAIELPWMCWIPVVSPSIKTKTEPLEGVRSEDMRPTCEFILGWLGPKQFQDFENSKNIQDKAWDTKPRLCNSQRVITGEQKGKKMADIFPPMVETTSRAWQPLIYQTC